MDRVLVILVVLATACGFSSNFVLGSNPTSQSFPLAFLLTCVELAVLIAPAAYAYLRPSNLRHVYVAALVLFVVGLPFALVPSLSAGGTVFRCALEALSITLTVSVLSLLPARSIFSTVSLSFAVSVLFVAGVNLLPGLSADLAAKILLTLYFAALGAALLIAPASALRFGCGRGEDGARQTPASIARSLFERRESMLPVVGIATLLMLVLGVFENHFLTGGFEFASSSASLLISAAIFVGLAVLGRVWHPSAWFARVFAGLMLVCVVGLMLMLLVPAAVPVLSGYFGVMTAVAMMPMCVYSAEIAKERGLSPVLVAGPLCVPITLGLRVGGLLDAALFGFLGADAYNVSSVAAIALAAIAGVVIVVFMLLGMRKAEASVPEEAPSIKNLDEALYACLLEKGLSEREAQIVVLYSQGRSVPYISRELALAESTIKSHIKHVYVKTGVHNKQDLLDFVGGLRR